MENINHSITDREFRQNLVEEYDGGNHEYLCFVEAESGGGCECALCCGFLEDVVGCLNCAVARTV